MPKLAGKITKAAEGADRFLFVTEVAGRKVGFSAVAGEVVAVERWTETQVSSAPGSVRVYGDQVTVSPPKIWASAVGRKAVWLRTASDELQIRVPADLAVRQGHRVHAVISTGMDRRDSQWAAIVNHGTNRWTQVDLFPPCRCYDPWTSFVMGFGQGFGNLAVGVMGLYGVGLGCACFYLERTGTALLTGLVLGLAVGVAHTFIGLRQSGNATRQYGKAMKTACDRLFAADA